jgi:hypothetical protein
LWPLLFLFDSLEQYAREIVGRVNNTGEAAIDAKEILDHLKFFAASSSSRCAFAK